ncbi:MAG: type II/IV secretion system protein [Halieaceae bacterium]|jgi:type IV pilus assembly protein PilB|nr:type II/IV secretion system protein [Deltaproteobacteria bacterium]MBT4520210.1 type II/IV secretion system protein [Halieaceae bacterium]
MLNPKKLSEQDIKKIAKNAIKPDSKISFYDLLLSEKIITPEQLKEIREKKNNQRYLSFSELVETNDDINMEKYIAAFCCSFDIPYIDLELLAPDTNALTEISFATVAKYDVFPLYLWSGELAVVFKDPSDNGAINAVNFETQNRVVVLCSPENQIHSAIEEHYQLAEFDKLIDQISRQYQLSGSGNISGQTNLEHVVNQPPVVKLANGIIYSGIREQASDINIRPTRSSVELHYRIDGKMLLVKSFNLELLNALVGRIKIMGGMDIAERRLPQDGHASVNFLNRDVDLRISIIPTIEGESIVIRILDQSKGILTIDQLGLEGQTLERFSSIIQHNNGIFLITGPTGSGKTSTLYSIIESRKHSSRHIISVEDPVEYHISGIEQIQINPKIGYSFSESLRHILRHDPDDVLIGEMRDTATAEIAVKAALTGHFVMSTLHTNDAPGAITRLTDMGLQPYKIASCIVGVLAQRLIRKICSHCKSEVTLDEKLVLSQGFEEDITYYEGKGCKKCHGTGFKGRLMVCEIMTLDDELRGLILNGATAQELRGPAERNGMRSLKQHSLELVTKGLTTLKEANSINIEM